MEEVYQSCAKDVVRLTGYNYNPNTIAYHLMLQHQYAPCYPEVREFLNNIKSKYRVIICSDSNHLMVDPLIDQFGIKEVFISEDLKCYKGDQKGRFFQKVLAKLNIAPDRILHIGDSSADVIGARKANIAACWLNRDHREWKNAIQPDLIIDDLDQLKSIPFYS
jgi:HAD superfamily hydrolase (TIGR01509 family)